MPTTVLSRESPAHAVQDGERLDALLTLAGERREMRPLWDQHFRGSG